MARRRKKGRQRKRKKKKRGKRKKQRQKRRGRKKKTRRKDQKNRIGKLIIGLGNPGNKFKDTRHNVGFKIVDRLAEILDIDLKKTSHVSLFGLGGIEGEKVVLVKPLTYMNKSGHAVSSFLRYYRIPLENLLVIHDDADLELGRLRVRSRGGAGGHRGMESIIACLGERDFPRLRIGIKGKRRDSQLAGYVLKRFDKEEKTLVDQIVIEAAEAVQLFIKEGIVKAMNRHNRRSIECNH